MLRRHHELGLLPVPRSSDPQRQCDNLDIAGFELDADEVTALTALGYSGGRLRIADPDTTGFPVGRRLWPPHPDPRLAVVVGRVSPAGPALDDFLGPCCQAFYADWNGPPPTR